MMRVMNFAKKYWLGIGSMLVIGIFGFFLYKNFTSYYSYPSEKISEEMGKIVGKSLLPAFMVFLVVNFLRKRWGRQRKEFFLLCFTLSFSAYATYDLVIAKVKTDWQCKNFARELLSQSAGDSSHTPASQSVNEFSTEKYGDFAKILPTYNIPCNSIKKWSQK
jgi:hypothetical protein